MAKGTRQFAANGNEKVDDDNYNEIMVMLMVTIMMIMLMLTMMIMMIMMINLPYYKVRLWENSFV